MANFNFNKVILGGRLIKDVEIKTAGQTQVATFTIAVARAMSKDKTDFLRVTAFGKTAEFASKYFHKGSSICVVGRIQTDTVDKNGSKVTYTSVVADEINFVDSAAGNVTVKTYSGNGASHSAPTKSTPAPEIANAGENEEELPF